MAFPWHLYLMALCYVLAGLNHFRNPRLYYKIIPPFFKNPRLINGISGLAEIIFGILLCIPATSKFAAMGIILLLITVFPANVFMYTNDKARLGLPKWMLMIRLPLQIVLIIWAYQYTDFIH